MDEATKDNVRNWVKKADEDILTAQVLLKHQSDLAAVISFHAQQCAEKMLKAYLTAHGVHIEKTHDLSRLIKLCVGYKDGFAQFYDIADELSPYAVTTCYPDDRRICTQNEASEAVEKADKIKNFILSELQKLNIDKNG